MYKILSLFFVGVLSGCPDCLPQQTNAVVVEIANASAVGGDQDSLDKNERFWLNTSLEYSDSIHLCGESACTLIALSIVGAQSYLGNDYDSVDVINMMGGVSVGAHYLFDSEYKIYGDSVILRYVQTNGVDTVKIERTYYLK